jgi:hypothetical protein
MDTQLRLLPGESAPPRPSADWQLDDDTRRVGRRGVALAREALRAANRPRPDDAEPGGAAPAAGADAPPSRVGGGSPRPLGAGAPPAPRRHDPAA